MGYPSEGRHNAPLFRPGAVALVVSTVFVMPYNTSFKFRQCHVIQYGLILFLMHFVLKMFMFLFMPNIAKNRKYVCITYFSFWLHTFLLFSYFTPKLQLLGYIGFRFYKLQLKLNNFSVGNKAICFDLFEWFWNKDVHE